MEVCNTNKKWQVHKSTTKKKHNNCGSLFRFQKKKSFLIKNLRVYQYKYFIIFIDTYGREILLFLTNSVLKSDVQCSVKQQSL